MTGGHGVSTVRTNDTQGVHTGWGDPTAEMGLKLEQ